MGSGMWLIDLLRELLSALFSEFFPSTGEYQQRRRRGQPAGNASSGDERSQEGAEQEAEDGCAPLH